MVNSSAKYFVLDMYVTLGNLRFLVFVLVLLLYMSIVCANVLLILVICMNRSLHEPMYVFLVNLFVNELYGSTGLFPFLLLQLLSDLHHVSTSLCFLQIFCLYTYANVQFCNLTIMSYDRYLAICRPLQYNARMTCNKAVVLVAVVWLYSSFKVLVLVSLSSNMTLCGNKLDSLYCHNYLIVKLACSDTTAINIYGIFAVVLAVLVPLLPTFFSYTKILQVCFTGSKQTRQKAVNTCTPRLVSLLNFSFGCLFEIVQSRFRIQNMSKVSRIFLSVYFAGLQALLNPVMFGIQMSKLRKSCRTLLTGCRGS